jgi:hypothetical protein
MLVNKAIFYENEVKKKKELDKKTKLPIFALL